MFLAQGEGREEEEGREGRGTIEYSLTVPSTYVGKHPVCVLQEVCVKKHWGVPNYVLVDCAGPAHMRTFLFKVCVCVCACALYVCAISDYVSNLYSISCTCTIYVFDKHAYDIFPKRGRGSKTIASGEYTGSEGWVGGSSPPPPPLPPFPKKKNFSCKLNSQCLSSDVMRNCWQQLLTVTITIQLQQGK